MTNEPPVLWSVLTTRTATIDTAAFKDARHRVREAVTRRWPSAQCATLIEFTTGRGTHSGGRRRPHWNDTWKGVPVEDGDHLRRVLAEAWCGRVDALPRGQHVQPIAEVGGLMRYLALHFQKESQAPPAGWRGHRFRTTRGYLAEPMAAARERARGALRFRRELRQAHADGLEGEEAVEVARDRLGDAVAVSWELVRSIELPDGELVYAPVGAITAQYGR